MDRGRETGVRGTLGPLSCFLRTFPSNFSLKHGSMYRESRKLLLFLPANSCVTGNFLSVFSWPRATIAGLWSSLLCAAVLPSSIWAAASCTDGMPAYFLVLSCLSLLVFLVFLFIATPPATLCCMMCLYEQSEQCIHTKSSMMRCRDQSTER